MIIEKCSQIEFDLCIWTYLGRWGTDVICVSAEMRFCLNHYLVKNVSFLRSLPARGVWIEILLRSAAGWCFRSLPARGVWIEIYSRTNLAKTAESLPARGVWIEIWSMSVSTRVMYPSLPARGVWIEMSTQAQCCSLTFQSLPARGVWIEIFRRTTPPLRDESLPARGVWIEMPTSTRRTATWRVAPRKGSVD